jgi:predicted RNase H-like nuclease
MLGVQSYALGVDGCKAGWISARRDAAGLNFGIYANFAELLVAHPTATIAIDIPIGLSESGEARACDVQARTLVGPRRSSIFPAPDRCILKCSTHAEASSANLGLCGKGISQQAFAICRKIREVDVVMSLDLQQRVFEVHPELCFWKLAGQKPLAYPKRKSPGFEERRVLLTGGFPGVHIPKRTVARQLGAGPDDVLDSLVALWTAQRILRGHAERIPVEPKIDPRGLRMEMVY